MPETGQSETQAPVRFEAVDVYMDSGEVPLAAYQFELAAETGEIKIVGIEGGEHPAFKEPPYYDPAALSNDRIIIAAFNTGQNLPSGKTRVARVHLQIIGEREPQLLIRIEVTASAQGQEIPAAVTLEKGGRK
jgi:hypothetical protein